jgi:hypothetical protein
VALKDKVMNQTIGAINFEEIEARAIETISRSKARGTQLIGIMERGHVEDGEVEGWDCLIHGLINCI